MHCMGMIMNRHFQKTIKNQMECVPCVPSWLPLLSNGTHAQTALHKPYIINVYYVYHCARVRIRAYFQTTTFNTTLININPLKQYSHVRIFVYMVHMVNILLKALSVKALLCFPFFVNIHKKLTNLNIAFQDVDFNILFLCTFAAGLL